MAIDIYEGIEPGDLRIRVLTTNEVSVTLQASERFEGKIIQPETAATGLLGEHGLGVCLEVKEAGAKHVFLFDTGGLNASILHNMPPMNVKLGEVEKVVVSHGHFDHTGSLAKVIPELRPGCELIIHPSAYLQNQIVLTHTGEEIPLNDFGKAIRELKKADNLIREAKLPQLNKALIEKAAADKGVKIVETTSSSKLCEGVYTSGEIEIVDPAEVTPGFYLWKSKTEVEKHTFRDEIALYINVKGKGLVVLTGCGHTGILNIIRHGQKLMGVDQIYAVIGGFHFEMSPDAYVDQEIQALQALKPEIICGMHCTGLAFNAKMIGQPAHVQGVVGTEFRL